MSMASTALCGVILPPIGRGLFAQGAVWETPEARCRTPGSPARRRIAAPRYVIPLYNGRQVSNSEELFDHVNRSVSADLADTGGKQPVQEGILRVGRFEARQRSEVAAGRRAVVPNALECHVDEGALVSLECDAQVELHHAVGAFDRPIVAAGQHFAAKPLTFE